ncbi:uncharacterized protein LOC135820826 isoform X2 [Sycon ciliatum]|uniref:uncharacterized protein LOC135820826 isoform X2 n=1 Tax=Sycon ciliatum TaxID=27933 RepID=UPI0031F6632E
MASFRQELKEIALASLARAQLYEYLQAQLQARKIEKCVVGGVSGSSGKRRGRKKGGGARGGGGGTYALGQSEAWTMYLVNRDGIGRPVPVPASLALGRQAKLL